MIYQDIQITVNQGLAVPDKALYIFRGDSNIILNFKLVTPQYMISKNNKDNLVTRFGVDNFELRLQLEKGYDRVVKGIITKDGYCRTQLTNEVIQSLLAGTYTYQITLIDNDNNAIMTFPACINKLNILNRISATAREFPVPEGLSGEVMADLSLIVQNEDKIEAFDDEGNYIKTNWDSGDIISSAKLNKVEEALDKINQNEINNTAALDEKMTFNFNVLQNHLDNKLEEVDSQLAHKATKTRYDAVLDFGFDNTGNTNNSQKWYDLMEYSRNVKKIEVIFPPGVYLLSSRVLYQPSTSICENIKLIGENGAIIKFAGSVKNIALWFNFGTEGVTKPDFEFCGFEIDGTENGKWEGAGINQVQVYPIKLDSCNYVNIHDNYIHDVFVGGGITVYRTNFCDIKNNRLINVYGCGNDSFGDAIYVGQSTKYANVEGNYVYNDIINTENNMGRCGIVYEFQTYSSTIKNNIIFGYDRAIHIEITKYNELITIESNKISGCNTGVMIWNTLSRIRILNNSITNENALLTKQKYTLGYQSGIICLEPMRCPRTEIIGNTVSSTYNELWSPLKVLNFASTANGTAPDGTTKKFYAENYHVEENIFEDNYPIEQLDYFIHMPMKSNFINNKIKTKKIRFGCNVGVKFMNNDVDCTAFTFISADFSNVNTDIFGNIDVSSRRPGFMANLKSEFISNKFYCSRDVQPDIRLIYLLGDFINNTILGWTSELLPYHTNNPTYCYGEISGNVFDSLGVHDLLAYGNAYGYTTKIPNKYIKKDGSIINHSYLASPISTSRGNIEVTLKAIPTVDTWIAGDRVINSNPTVGSPKSWICVEGGTPGTWVSEGNL